MVSADKEKEDRQKAEINACLAEYAAKANVSIDKFSNVVLNFVERMIPPSALDPQKFSSRNTYQAVRDAMVEVDKLFVKHSLEI